MYLPSSKNRGEEFLQSESPMEAETRPSSGSTPTPTKKPATWSHLFKSGLWIKLLSSAFYEVFSNSTAHALPNVLRSHNWIIRIMWIILFLGGIVGAIIFCYLSTDAFFNYEVTVSIDTVNDAPVDFPSVTVCNLNPFDYATSSSYFEKQLNASGLSVDITPTADEPAIYQVKRNLRLLKAISYSQVMTNASFVKNLSWSWDTLRISCFYNGAMCNDTDFYYWTVFDFINCYTFNSLLNSSSDASGKQTSKTGPEYGLTMEIFVGFSGTNDYFMEKRGLYVAVHNTSMLPLTRYEGVRVPVGAATDVSFTRTYTSKLGSPYSSCISPSGSSFTSIYYRYTLQLFDYYSQKLCTEFCLQFEFIKPNCSCNDPSIPYVNDDAICKNQTKLDCVDDVRAEFDSSSLSESCSSYCPDVCSGFEYDVTTQQADYPTDYYYSVISKQPNVMSLFSNSGLNITSSVYKYSTCLVNVYYSDIKYTEITESPALTFDQVVGIIGGQLGLFIGMSMLSLFEPAEALIEFITQMIKHKFAANRIKQTENEKI